MHTAHEHDVDTPIFAMDFDENCFEFAADNEPSLDIFGSSSYPHNLADSQQHDDALDRQDCHHQLLNKRDSKGDACDEEESWLLECGEDVEYLPGTAPSVEVTEFLQRCQAHTHYYETLCPLESLQRMHDTSGESCVLRYSQGCSYVQIYLSFTYMFVNIYV